MIKAVIFDMFETLVTLFEGRTYFGEDIATDVGVDATEFRREWHATENARSIGELSIEEALRVVLKKLSVYSEEKVKLTAGKRVESLNDTFSAIPEDSIKLLKELKNRGIKVGLITNTFSDERDFIRNSPLFKYFDVALISYEQGICKPAPELYRKMARLLDVEAKECLYVGDGGSKELYAARSEGMHAVQCTWFHERAFEPHIPCPILDEFDHANTQLEILGFLKEDEEPEELDDIVKMIDGKMESGINRLGLAFSDKKDAGSVSETHYYGKKDSWNPGVWGELHGER